MLRAARALDVDLVFIGIPTGEDSDSVGSVAVCDRGEILPNFTYVDYALISAIQHARQVRRPMTAARSILPMHRQWPRSPDASRTTWTPPVVTPRH